MKTIIFLIGFLIFLSCESSNTKVKMIGYSWENGELIKMYKIESIWSFYDIKRIKIDTISEYKLDSVKIEHIIFINNYRDKSGLQYDKFYQDRKQATNPLNIFK